MEDVKIDPRYSKHSNQEIERILDSVATIDGEPTPDSPNPISSGAVATALDHVAENLPESTEENVRNIVRNWTPDAEPEPESEEEPGE